MQAMKSRIKGVCLSVTALGLCALAVWSSGRFAAPRVQADEGVRTIDVTRLEARAALGPAEDVSQRVIVQFKSGVADRLAERCVDEAGGGRAVRSAFGQRYVVDPMAGLSAEALTARLGSMPEVEFAERDGMVHAHFSPNDSLYRLQWHLKTLGVERMWDIPASSFNPPLASCGKG